VARQFEVNFTKALSGGKLELRMNKRERYSEAIFLVLLFLCSLPRAFACSCGGYERPCQSLAANVAFVGTVLETVAVEREQTVSGRKVSFNGYDIRFRVDEPLRGVDSAQLVLGTGSGGGDCGTPYPPGTRLLIFGYRDDNGKLGTGLCMGNEILDGIHDEETLAPYRALAKQKGRVSIFGAVLRGRAKLDDDGSIDEGETKPWPAVHVLLASDSIALDIVTGKDGTFEFRDLPNGTYRLKPALSDRFDYSREYEENYVATVSDGSCRQVGFIVYPATRIRGRLILPDNAPSQTIEVVAFPTSMKQVGGFAGKWDYTGEDGKFDLWPLLPGDYLVAVNANKSPSTDAPYPATYYPGVTKRETASVIHVNEGDTREIEFRVGDLELPRTISISVVLHDGTPAKGAYAYLEDLDHPGGRVGSGVTPVLPDGSQNLTGFVGRKYRVHAVLHKGVDNELCAAPVSVPMGGERVHLKVVVSVKSKYCGP
jgi:hypothetical protein